MFIMRFDMRAPQPGASTSELYATALEMCTWAETRGCPMVVICEHHASPDGYLPAPLIMGTAVAARTQRMGIMLAATLLPFYDPVRLAEEMNVLDIISGGRVSYVLGVGYRPEEFEQFGVDRTRRGAIAEEKLRLLLELRTGEPVEYEGRRIHVTPPPVTPGGPRILWGGHSIAAARRAGRYGLGLQAHGTIPGMREAYEEESRAHGHEPGFINLPDKDTPSVVFVADDVDRAWEELGPHIFHDARTYSSWNEGDETTSMISHAKTLEELRATAKGYRIMSIEEASEHAAGGHSLNLAPLCGGVPPAVAWPYLARAAQVSASTGARRGGS